MTQRSEVISTNPDVLGGVRVFRGSRVPVRSLLDYLAAGGTLGEFLEDFPSVSREQVQAVLDLASEALTAGAGSS